MADDHDSDDESIDINLRSIDEVAARMVVLAAVIRRAVLELPLDVDDDPDSIHEERFDLMTALSTGSLSSVTTSQELNFVTAQIGDTGEEMALAAIWQLEALAALAWATGLDQLLSQPWIQTEPGPLLASVPEPWDELSQFAASLSLLDEEVIAIERERAELWSWRAWIDYEFEYSKESERRELLAILKEAVEEAVESGVLAEGKRDFIVRGRGYGSANAETKALIAEISTQRLRVFGCAATATPGTPFHWIFDPDVILNSIESALFSTIVSASLFIRAPFSHGAKDPLLNLQTRLESALLPPALGARKSAGVQPASRSRPGVF